MRRFGQSIAPFPLLLSREGMVVENGASRARRSELGCFLRILCGECYETFI